MLLFILNCKKVCKRGHYDMCLLLTSLPRFFLKLFFFFFNFKSNLVGSLLKMPFYPCSWYFEFFKELDWHCFSLWIKERWSVTKAWSIVGSREFWNSCQNWLSKRCFFITMLTDKTFGDKILRIIWNDLRLLWGEGFSKLLNGTILKCEYKEKKKE